MGRVTIDQMRSYLRRSISSGPTGQNLNKIRGLLAEIAFREHLQTLGFADRISVGGWIARPKRVERFGEHTIALFPQIITPDVQYDPAAPPQHAGVGLHSIAARFAESGITPWWCAARVPNDGIIEWDAQQLGLPREQPFRPLAEAIGGFTRRERRQNFLTGKTDVSTIPAPAIPEEFSKEHLRVSFQELFFCELVDIDGVFWGRQHTYPIEIKEKTRAADKDIGAYFGLDIGPFVKLAFYAAKRGNLRSIFVVREINNTTERALIAYQHITFDELAQVASWLHRGGGRNMRGGSSTVVRIPVSAFSELTKDALETL